MFDLILVLAGRLHLPPTRECWQSGPHLSPAKAQPLAQATNSGSDGPPLGGRELDQEANYPPSRPQLGHQPMTWLCLITSGWIGLRRAFCSCVYGLKGGAPGELSLLLVCVWVLGGCSWRTFSWACVCVYGFWGVLLENFLLMLPSKAFNVNVCLNIPCHFPCTVPFMLCKQDLYTSLYIFYCFEIMNVLNILPFHLLLEPIKRF